jgi:hypothetical protein
VGYALRFTNSAANRLKEIDTPDQRPRKKLLRRSLGLLESDPSRPELRSHKYTSVRGANGEDVWESFIGDPAAADWRMFWHYGPEADTITVASITRLK